MVSLTLMPLALRVSLGFCLFFALFSLYGKHHFYRDPGSVFYDQNRAYERRYSDVRLRQVQTFRHAIEHDASGLVLLPFSFRQPSEMCVSMTTVKRRGLERQYVEDAIISMLDGITSQERALLHISLLFTDLDTSEHPSWHQPWLRSVVDDVWSYDFANTSIDATMHEWLHNVTLSKTKASMDYTLALQRCLDQTDAPYIAILEDDILVAPGWVAPTLSALRSAGQLMHKQARSWFQAPSAQRGWMDIRLFTQERSTGWGSNDLLGNDAPRIILGVDLILCLVVLIMRKRKLLQARNLDNMTLAVLCLLVIPFSVTTFFRAGKASLLAPRPGLRVQNFGCCSQALVFNREHVPALIEDLRQYAIREAEGQIEHENYDLRTRDFAGGHDLDRLALYPVQVQHMGVTSALGTTQDEAQSVWSMAFEDLKDESLRARHDAAMDRLFGTGWRGVVGSTKETVV